MTIKLYTEEQIALLLQNQYVAKCSPKHLTFTDACKQEAVRLHQAGLISSKDIFRTLLFPDFIINSYFPKETLKRWRKMEKQEGIS